MKIKDIIKEKYKVARKYYETYKHTTECSYYMGYMDALGELLEKIELEEEKKIPEKLGEWAYVDGEIEYNWSQNEAILKTRINEIIDYLKSKGE